MSHLPPPPIDPRAYGDFVLETEALLRRYTGCVPAADDPAGAHPV